MARRCAADSTKVLPQISPDGKRLAYAAPLDGVLNVFVGDVVAANVLLAEAELPAPDTIDARGFNVGTSAETSVNELARTLMSAVPSCAIWSSRRERTKVDLR